MKILRLTFIALGIFAMVSCTKYPPTSSRLLEDLAVLTQYDVNTNFGLYKTYSIVDTVYYITDKGTQKIISANTKIIINQIIADMNARGFKQVAKSAKPDLGINVSAIKTTTTVYYPGWYWGYPGYYPPDWWGYNGYYYPYYPTYYTSYSAGTLVIEMVNFKNITPAGDLPVVWDAIIRGLVTDTHTTTDVTNSIDQCFTQTPSIKTSL
ncbi:MAG: DUF4136 domain-containing protein [Bacteroidetes bacterium]|nr:DUF4136 domain-containing protein [Bacteroidota bacterium]